MRRLTAYRERYTQVPAERTNGKLTVVEQVITPYSAAGLTLIARFTYNYNNYAVVLYRVDGTEINTTTLAAIGVSASEMVIPVVSWLWANFFGSNVYSLRENIGSLIAKALGMQIYSISSDATYITTVMVADEARTSKRITSITDVNGTYIFGFTAATYAVTVYTQSTERYDFFDLELDDSTAIGITHQGYNPEDPTKIGFKVSNSFTIPYTANNAKLVGFCGANDDVFDPWFLSYFIDNNRLINGGRCMVSEVSGLSSNGSVSNGTRMSITITDNSTIWDRMKEVLWPEFMAEYYEWMEANYVTEWDTFNDFINAIVEYDYHEHIRLGCFQGDHHPDSEVEILDDYVQYRKQPISTINIAIGNYDGGNLCTYCDSVFKFILVKFGIDFFKGSLSVFDSYYGVNPFLAYFQNRYLVVKKTATNGFKVAFSKGTLNSSTGEYKSDKSKKTVLDFVKEFIVHTGCLVDVISDTEIALQRIDDLMQSPAVDFSGRIDPNSISYYPVIDGVAQLNYLDFSEYSEKITEKSLRQTIVCNNKNVDPSADYIELKEFAPPSYFDRDRYILGLFEDGSRSSFTFLGRPSTGLTYNIKALFDVSSPYTKSKDLGVAIILPIGYSMWASMVGSPRRYKLKKWLTSADVANLKQFQRYWITELQGTFMLLKVSGLNPDKSNDATELEFIQITGDKPTTV